MEPSPQLLEGAALPFCLRHLPEPPARLYLHGTLPSGPRVAIVGTRLPTDAALEYAGYLAGWLAERGIAVVSGGAKGIDAAAHQGALAASGSTLVVASSSFDRPFPSEHRQLFEDIVARGGGYLSRFARGVEPRRRSEEHTSELQSQSNLVCRLLLEKKKKKNKKQPRDADSGVER